MSTVVSSPNFEDTEVLYGKYLEMPGNEDKSIDMFYEFLAIESIDRQLFLDEYCMYDFITVENSVVLKYSLKHD